MSKGSKDTSEQSNVNTSQQAQQQQSQTEAQGQGQAQTASSTPSNLAFLNSGWNVANNFARTLYGNVLGRVAPALSKGFGAAAGRALLLDCISNIERLNAVALRHWANSSKRKLDAIDAAINDSRDLMNR